MPVNILFLDDSEDLREVVALLLQSNLGEKCLCVESVDELKTVAKQALNCRLIILDINLGSDKPTGLDAYDWLRKIGFKGKINFLTGHARAHPLVIKASEKGAGVWSKPFSTDEFCQSVAEILKTEAAT